MNLQPVETDGGTTTSRRRSGGTSGMISPSRSCHRLLEDRKYPLRSAAGSAFWCAPRRARDLPQGLIVPAPAVTGCPVPVSRNSTTCWLIRLVKLAIGAGGAYLGYYYIAPWLRRHT